MKKSKQMRLRLLFLILGAIIGIVVTIKLPFIGFEFSKTISSQLNIPLWTVRSGGGVGLAIGIFALCGFLLGWLLEKIAEYLKSTKAS